MKSFKDYQPSPVPDERETLARAVTEPDPALESSAAELTKKIAAAYNGKSSADMFRNILSEAEKSKRAGEQFSPLLDNAKRRQLKSVVERLKRI